MVSAEVAAPKAIPEPSKAAGLFNTCSRQGVHLFRPDELPAELTDVLATVRGWSQANPTAFTPDEKAAWLAGLRQLVDATETVFTETLAAFDAAGDGQNLHGARTTSAWLRGALHLAPGDTCSRVRVARQLDQLEDVTDKVMTGDVTYEQTRAIAESLRPLPDDDKAQAVGILTELAEKTDAAAVRGMGRQILHFTDPDRALQSYERNFERRYLHMSPLLDGMVALNGLLDPEGAAVVNTALQPFLVRQGTDDIRETGQRRADGLVELANLALQHDNLSELGGNRVRLQVHCDVRALNAVAVSKSRGGNDASVPSSQRAPAQLPGTPDGFGLLPHRHLIQQTCDAVVARILVGADSVPLDFGRDRRLFSSAQRSALATRDGGCRFPACTPASLTDAHHVLSWLNGGDTAVANAVLLCRFHHRKMDGGGWTIERSDGCPSNPDGTVNSNFSIDFVGPVGQRLTSSPAGPLHPGQMWSFGARAPG